MYGYVSYKLIRADGTIEESEGKNTIVDSGLNRWGEFLVSGNRGTAGIDKIKFGNAVQFFTNEERQTTLVRETFESPIYNKVYLEEKPDGEIIPTEKQTFKVSYRFKIGMFEPDENVDISEMGLFTRDNTMFSYYRFESPFEKRTNDILFVDWVIVVNPVIGRKPVVSSFSYNEFWKMQRPPKTVAYVGNISESGIVINWDKIDEVGIAGYNIYRKEYPNNDFELLDTVYSERARVKTNYNINYSYLDSGIQWGKVYTYYIKTLNVSDLESDPSNELVVPTIHLSVYPKDEKAELFWTGCDWGENIKSYKIYSILNSTQIYSAQNSSQKVFIAETDETMYIARNLQNDKIYYFGVSAVDVNDVEYYISMIKNATPQKNYPSVPLIIHEESLDEAALLTWYKLDDATNYNLYRLYDDLELVTTTVWGYSAGQLISFETSAFVPVYSYMSTLSYDQKDHKRLQSLINGLINEENYMFTIQSVDEEGDTSQYSNVAYITPKASILPAPINFNAEPGNELIVLKWNKVDKAIGYKVYMFINGEWVLKADTQSIFYIVFGLQNYNDYMFKIAAVDFKGRNGIESETILATPIDDVPPNAPILKFSVVRNYEEAIAEITLSWDSVDTANLYKVYGAGGEIGEFTEIGEVDYTETSFVYSASLGERYSFFITAMDENNNESLYSNEALVNLL